MPRRENLKKVLIIGSGPIVIGQACEFDYSGTQACKALRALGYKIVLVNSNPATIMTDPVVADVTYIEPLTIDSLTKIIEKERPDALLPNLGGQTGLNLSSELARLGILEKYGVDIIGVPLDAIQRGEDREAFKDTMNRLGIEMPRSEIIHTIEQGMEVVGRLGLPVVVRPAYTMGGTGGGLVYNMDEFREVVTRGLAASRIGQCLIEESIEGWEELELEVVRDAGDRMITVCFIENVDAVGVHTGDSCCTAPMLTISPELQKRLQEFSYEVVRSIGVIGGTNVQFAHDPKTGRVVIIEINPRTSRSSALASKATGFPIALVSAKLAGGLTMSELPYWRGDSLAAYEPSGDYVVVKFARWAFAKFPGLVDRLGTQMRAVGEVMSIGKNYKEAFQKAIRSLEIGCHGLGAKKELRKLSLDELLKKLAYPTSQRQFVLYEAIRRGADLDDLSRRTFIKRWFLEQMKELVDREEELLVYRGRFAEMPDDLLVAAKKEGFADRYLAWLLETPEPVIRNRRISLGVVAKFQPINVSGVEKGAYYYSTYNATEEPAANVDVGTSGRRKVMVLGGGPNRIGQGIEFDYCCVHAAFALRDMGCESIMVNCNPETVSTDYDTSDRLYFEP
ncbi:MAG: carbamoyl-phosphate synthase large subunit, partial [Planctomycetia bacterium]|nr:carbamoyl-phosphate synthase large subunit [Planctomycetia bacterium]